MATEHRLPRSLICAALASSLLGCGTAQVDPVSLGHAEIDACGARRAHFTVHNPGTSTTRFDAHVEPADFGTVTPTTAEVPPGGDLELTIDVASNVTPPATASVILTGDVQRRITVDFAAGSAELVPSTKQISFGDVAVGTTSLPVSVDVRNAGTKPVSLGFLGTAEFSAGWAGGAALATIPPGETRTAVLRFTPSATGAPSAIVRFVVDGVPCTSQGIDVTGGGVTSILTVVPDSLDWGGVDCGDYTPAPPKAVTVTNTGGRAVDVDFSFPSGSYFSVTPLHATIAAGATLTARVERSWFWNGSSAIDVKQDVYAADLSISSTAPGEAVRHLRNHITARGTRLVITQSHVDFGDVRVAQGKSISNVFIYNGGNVDTQVTFQKQGLPSYPWPSFAPLAVKAGGSVELPLTLTQGPATLGAWKDYFGVVSSAPSCDEYQPQIDLAVHGFDRAASATGSGQGCIVSTSGFFYTSPTADHPHLEDTIPTATAVQTVQGGTCRLQKTGTLDCNGSIGYQSTFSQPTTIAGLGTIRDIAAGLGHVCILSDPGSLVGVVSCLGNNDNGQLGDGSATSTLTPVSTGLVGMTRVVARNDFTCALDGAKALWCWGKGDSRYSDGFSIHSVPIPMNLPSPVDDLALDATAIAFRPQGSSIPSWFKNPVAVQSLFTPLGALSGSCGLRNDGAVLCWGDGTSGALGDGINTPHSTNVPQPIFSNSTFTKLAGGFVSSAITVDGRVAFWGAGNPVTWVHGFD